MLIIKTLNQALISLVVCSTMTVTKFKQTVIIIRTDKKHTQSHGLQCAVLAFAIHAEEPNIVGVMRTGIAKKIQ